MDLFMLKEVGQLRFHELLREAEHERLCRRVQGNQARQQRLLVRAGDVLIALGQRLKDQAQPQPARPTFHAR